MGDEFMLCIYFSGTGNTKHISDRLAKALGCASVSIEDPTAAMKIAENKRVALCFPVYSGSSPLIMREFIETINWKSKKVFIIVTKGMFTGRSISNTAALLREKGADVIGGYSFKMPESIGDIPMFPIIMPPSKNAKVIANSEKELDILADKMKRNLFPQMGLNAPVKAEAELKTRMKIDKSKCTECGLCRKNCPYVEKFGTRCTLCYRCFANCPAQAITGLGKKVIYQYTFPE
jgi:flavodoxin/ferredoxin